MDFASVGGFLGRRLIVEPNSSIKHPNHNTQVVVRAHNMSK